MTLALAALAAFAQTADEIIARMDAELSKYDTGKAALTVDLKIPLIGIVSSNTYTIGEKARVEAEVKGIKIITWTDGITDWTYNSDKNEVEIKKAAAKKKDETDGDIGMFSGITKGYEVSLASETPTAWNLRCKRLKSNKDKDAPKTMDLSVDKKTYFPLSLSCKISGMDMTMRNISFDVTEADVTFNPANFPDAKIIDKR